MNKKYDKQCMGGDDCKAEEHLCKLARRCEPDQIREIIRDARYFCRKCGRSAHEADNLCKPVDL
jgi:hypothetical protein